MLNQTINFPKLTESPYKKILGLIEAGQNLVGYYDEGFIFESDKVRLLIALSHLERVIDSYRALVPPDSSIDYPEDNSLVNAGLNKLRNKIWDIRGSLDDADVSSGLESEGESFKLRFREK